MLLIFLQLIVPIQNVPITDFATKELACVVKAGEVKNVIWLTTRPDNVYRIVRVMVILTSKLKNVFVEVNGPETIAPKVKTLQLKFIAILFWIRRKIAHLT